MKRCLTLKNVRQNMKILPIFFLVKDKCTSIYQLPKTNSMTYHQQSCIQITALPQVHKSLIHAIPEFTDKNSTLIKRQLLLC